MNASRASRSTFRWARRTSRTRPRPPASSARSRRSSPLVALSISERLGAIRVRIAEAARRSGREASAVQLVAVSKFQPPAAMEEAYAAGQRAFGENRVQEAEEKRRLLAPLIESAS